MTAKTDPVVSTGGTPLGVGAELERIATGGLPRPPRITNSAGCVRLAPPTGTIATAIQNIPELLRDNVTVVASGTLISAGTITLRPRNKTTNPARIKGRS